MTGGTAPQVSRHEVEAKIVKRCWEQDDFRREFLKDPTGCFVKYLNAPANQVPQIVVHEEQAGTWHIVIPAKPAQMGELSDEDLEKIAGGTDIVLATVGMFLASVTVGAGTGVAMKSGW